MNTSQTQDKINQREWEDKDNWSTLYFSKKDPRTFVPKQNPKLGWTINFGSKAGSKWLYYLFILFFLVGGILSTIFTALWLKMN